MYLSICKSLHTFIYTDLHWLQHFFDLSFQKNDSISLKTVPTVSTFAPDGAILFDEFIHCEMNFNPIDDFALDTNILF